MKAAGTWGRGKFNLKCIFLGHKYEQFFSQEIRIATDITTGKYLGTYLILKNNCHRCGYWERVHVQSIPSDAHIGF